MKKKQNELLKYLSMQKCPRTSSEIAQVMQISSRTVKEYISQINSFYNSNIVLSSRNGYMLNRHSYAFHLNAPKEAPIPQTNEERAYYVIKQLLLHHKHQLSLFDLCDYLYISYSTMKALLCKMNNMFSAYDIKFICKNDSVSIRGSEKNKRKLITYIINEESKTSFIDATQIKEFFKTLDVDALIRVITEMTKKHNCYFNDLSFANLLLHLVIVIDRKMHGNSLEAKDSIYEPETTMQEQNLLKDLCTSLETAFKIHLNPYEENEMLMLIKANANYLRLTSQQELHKTLGTEIIQLTDYYVHQLNDLYMVDLSADAFTTYFSLHLKNLLFRAKNGRLASNPMAEIIKMNNPIIFDMAIYISLDLMEKYNVMINEDETAFLAIHIGGEIERQNLNSSKTDCIFLCPEYQNINPDLLNKLLLNFGNQINIIRNIHNEKQLMALSQDLKFDDFILLLTTVPLKMEYSFTTINISPFNLQNQYETIQDAITTTQKEYKNYRLRSNFRTFFNKDLFTVNTSMNSREQILPFLCDKLKNKNYVNPDFEEKVYKRENAATTAFNNIAIPHSIDMDALKTSISVVISQKGIRWGKDTVYIVLLLAINKADKKIFRELYEALISLFGENSIISELRDCTNFEKFETLIYSYIQ